MMASIVTATFNSAATIADCLESVAAQTHAVEHIIIDGASTDNTLEIVRRIAPAARILSESDKGIYDAMNKGISLATGDIVGILNSDDFYADQHVIEKVVKVFDTHPVDSLFADLVYVRAPDLNKVVRYYSGAGFTLSKFALGWMPPHPTFFVRRGCYNQFGAFKSDYRIAADFELMARFLVKHRVSYHYLPEVLIKMRLGGASTRNLMSNWILNREALRACRENDISTNMLKIYSKYFVKSAQLFMRPQI